MSSYERDRQMDDLSKLFAVARNIRIGADDPTTLRQQPISESDENVGDNRTKSEPAKTIDISDDLRHIAAYEPDPRKEERIYEAADIIEELVEALRNFLDEADAGHVTVETDKAARAVLSKIGGGV